MRGYVVKGLEGVRRVSCPEQVFLVRYGDIIEKGLSSQLVFSKCLFG